MTTSAGAVPANSPASMQAATAARDGRGQICRSHLSIVVGRGPGIPGVRRVQRQATAVPLRLMAQRPFPGSGGHVSETARPMAQRKPAERVPANKGLGQERGRQEGRHPARRHEPPADVALRPGRPSAGRKPGKSIVNQRQTPWTLIAIVAVLVLFAGGIVAYAVTRHKDSAARATATSCPRLAAAKAIPGVQYKMQPQHLHVTGTVNYDTSPARPAATTAQFWANQLRHGLRPPDRERERRAHARARRGVDHLQPEDAPASRVRRSRRSTSPASTAWRCRRTRA